MAEKEPLIGLTIGCYHDLNKEIFEQENIDFETRKLELSNNYLEKIITPSNFKRDTHQPIPNNTHHVYVSPPHKNKEPNQVSIDKTILTINRLNELEVDWQHYIWTNNQNNIPQIIRNLQNVVVKDISEFADNILYQNILSMLKESEKDERALAGISDLLRYLALNKFGGAYFDFDYELFDAAKLYELMQNYDLIVGHEPKELSSYIGSSFVVSKAEHPVIGTALGLMNRNLNSAPKDLPEYLRYPCSSFSKRMYDIGPAMLTIAFYKAANSENNNDLLADDGRIFFNKKYIDYITPNTSCSKPNEPVSPINLIDGIKINTIGADTWCHAWPHEYFTCIYYPDRVDSYLYAATMGNNTKLMESYIEEGANPNFIYKNDTALKLAIRNQNIASTRLLVKSGAIVDEEAKILANSTGNYALTRSLSKLSKLDEIGCYANHTKEIFAQEGFDFFEEDKKIKTNYELIKSLKLEDKKEAPFHIAPRMVKIYVTSITEPKPIDNISLNKTITTFTRLKEEDSSWRFDIFTNNFATIPNELASMPNVKLRNIIELRKIDPEFWDNYMIRLLLNAESEKYLYAEISDILRVMSLFEGGFYQDFDGEVYRPEAFKELRKYNFVGGKELSYELTSFGNAFFGASANHPITYEAFQLIKRNLQSPRHLLPEYLQYPCNAGCKVIYDTGSPVLTTAYFKEANKNGSLDIIFPHKVFFNRDYARSITKESRCHNPKEIVKLDNETIAGDPFCGNWGIGSLKTIYYHENQNHHLYEAAFTGDIELLEAALADKADVNQAHYTKAVTPLNIAAHNGHYQIVKRLLEHKADPEIRNDGSTALLWAITKKHTDIVKLLLDHNADINATRPNNVSALFLASFVRSPEITRLLLDRGANKDILFEGETAFTYAQKNNYTEITKEFADYNTKQNSQQIKSSIQLSIAIARGDYREVEKLLDLGVDMEEPVGRFTALQTAAYFEQEAIIDLLLSRGARIISEGDFSALNIAQLKQNHTAKGNEIYHKLTEHYLNSEYFQETQFVIARYNKPLHWAIKELAGKNVIVYNKGEDDLDYLPDNFKVVKLNNQGREAHTYFYHIIKNYNNLAEKTVFLQDDPYDHPLYLPLKRFEYEQPDICKYITARCTKMHPNLAMKSVDLEQQLTRNYHNYTAPHTLIEFVHNQIDPFYDVNKTLHMVNGAQIAVSRKNILSHSIFYYQKLISFLRGLNPIEGYYFERIWDLIFNPKIASPQKITEALINSIMMGEPLLKTAKWLNFDIDPNYKTKAGFNALHFATLRNNAEIIPFLIAKGINVNSEVEKIKTTPLHLCAKHNFLDACKILIHSGANLNSYTPNNYTPLHLAIFGNHTEMVELLIENGAEVVSDKFMNPLELAARLENDHLHKILLAEYHKRLEKLDLKNKLACPVKDFSVVVVAFNEDISWIEKEFPCHDVTVYNKGERNLTDTDYYKVKKIENIGYFEGTQMKHIVDNYYNLPARTLFLQANPYDAFVFPELHRYAKDVNSTCHNIICKCDIKLHNLEAETIAMQKFDWESSKYKNFNHQNNNLTKFALKHIDAKIPPLFPICYASQYAVDKEVVYRHPLKHYQNLSQSINYDQYVIEGFNMERLNDLVYAEPIGKMIEEI